MSDRRLLLQVAAPFVVAISCATWLLWTRGEPDRQGGYCMNATLEIAAVLQRADRTGDVGRGPLPPVDRIFAQVDTIDAARFQVDTPGAVEDDVAELARTHSTDAFARIVEDYLARCRSGPDG